MGSLSMLCLYKIKVVYSKWFKLTILMFAIHIGALAMGEEPEFLYKNFNVNDGLSQSTVFSILQDTKGFMWFGTRTGGVNKFDGQNFINYKYSLQDTNGISGNQVRCLYQDTHENIWVGTHRDGLNKYSYSTDRFEHYNVDTNNNELIQNNSFLTIAEDASRGLWFGTGAGIYKYNRKENKIEHYVEGAFKDIRHVSSIAFQNDSLIWLGTKKELILLNINSNRLVKQYSSEDKNWNLRGSDINCLFVDSKNRVWIGTRKSGLNCLVDYKTDKFISFIHTPNNNKGLLGNFIRAIEEDDLGNIWIGSGHGIDLMDTSEEFNAETPFVHLQEAEFGIDGLSQNSVYSIYKDKESNFWVGTWSGGVDYLHKKEKKFVLYEKEKQSNSINNNTVTAFAQHGNILYVGTYGGGVNILNRSENTYKYLTKNTNSANNILDNNITSLLVDSENNLWIGSFGGVNVLSSKGHESEVVLTNQKVYAIENGMPGFVWIGTDQKLYRVNIASKDYLVYAPEQGNNKTLSYRKIKHIYKDSNNNIWVGTEIGLNKYNRDTDSFTQFLSIKGDSTSLSNSFVTSISEDVNGNLWVGTYDGLNLFKPETNTFVRYGGKEGLIDSDIENIKADNQGNLWITSSHGLARYSPQIGEGKYGSFLKRFSFKDGLQKGEFARNASYKNKEGEMFFGGTQGFNVFRPEEIVNDTIFPDLLITDFKLFNKSVRAKAADSLIKKHICEVESITLNYSQSVFSIEFIALNFVDPERNQYAYMLDGFDPEWNYIGEKRLVSYTNLLPGEYIFKVKSTDSDGVWSNSYTSLRIEVLTPWWRKWWFYLFVFIIVALGLYSFYLFRVRLLKEQRDRLEQMVEERTTELQESNYLLEESNDEITAQKLELQNALSELQKTQDSLIQSEKMASIGILASGIAHEINNPLNFIEGGKTIINEFFLKQDNKTRKKLSNAIAMIDTGISRASEIVTSLGHFNKYTVGIYEEFDINQSIDNCITILKHRLGVRIKLEKSYIPSNILIEGNEGEIHQLILNILVNAEQAIAEEGRISISTAVIDDKVEIRITDTGSGIPPEDIQKVTLPFYTTKDPGVGKGLGMSISYNIIKRHKGTISYESEPGKETTVTIILPLKNMEPSDLPQ